MEFHNEISHDSEIADDNFSIESAFIHVEYPKRQFQLYQIEGWRLRHVILCFTNDTGIWHFSKNSTSALRARAKLCVIIFHRIIYSRATHCSCYYCEQCLIIGKERRSEWVPSKNLINEAAIGALYQHCGKCVDTTFRLQGFVYIIELNYEICVNYSPLCATNIHCCPGY